MRAAPTPRAMARAPPRAKPAGSRLPTARRRYGRGELSREGFKAAAKAYTETLYESQREGMEVTEAVVRHAVSEALSKNQDDLAS